MKALGSICAGCAGVLLALGVLAVLLGAGQARGACSSAGEAGPGAAGGSWQATSYGPPWGGIEGDGMTATGLDLRGSPPAYEIAVDPRLIPLGSYVYVQPNPFGTDSAFYAGDTGGAIVGRHIDFYDWRGRASQAAWGVRKVTVTPAGSGEGGGCSAVGSSAEPPSGEKARILPDGSAVAPSDAPPAVRLAIAAGNLIHTRPYPEPDVHYGSLARMWPAYDCSGATSFLLYAVGLMGASSLDSTGLEGYGKPGPGQWITVYANAGHAWIVVAGIALDTADYGGVGVPGGSGPRWRGEALANLGDGSTYVVRHPAGL